ncbi:MAG TPA: hypothetical protein VIT65_16745 [Microlunatus sp.]
MIIKVADVPVGILLAIVGIICFILSPPQTEVGKALLTAAGLFGIGHGVHTAAKVRKTAIGAVGRSLAEQAQESHDEAETDDDPDKPNQGPSTQTERARP